MPVRWVTCSPDTMLGPGRVAAQVDLSHQRVHRRSAWAVIYIFSLDIPYKSVKQWCLMPQNSKKFVQKFTSFLIRMSKNSSFFGMDVTREKWEEGHCDKIHSFFNNFFCAFETLENLETDDENVHSPNVHSCGFFSVLLMRIFIHAYGEKNDSSTVRSFLIFLLSCLYYSVSYLEILHCHRLFMT